MLPELGVIALACGFVTALLLAGTGFTGARVLARSAAQAQFVFVAFAFGVLAWSFAQGDFSIQYVAQHSNSKLPLEYRLAAVWGGHEGSLLLWTLILAGWTVAVAARSHRLPDALGRARARHDGRNRRRVPGVCAVRIESVSAPVAGRARRPRPESPAAGPGHGVPSAAPLHGLRRLLGGVRVRHSGARGRTAGSPL
jgi:hypothetical protein